MPKVIFFFLKQSCPVRGTGYAMMIMMMSVGKIAVFHIGRDFSTAQRMWQGLDII